MFLLRQGGVSHGMKLQTKCVISARFLWRWFIAAPCFHSPSLSREQRESKLWLRVCWGFAIFRGVVSGPVSLLRNAAAALMHKLRPVARLGSAGAPKKKSKRNVRAINFNCLYFGSCRQHEEYVLADDPRQPLRGQHQRSHAEVGVLLHTGSGLGKPL